MNESPGDRAVIAVRSRPLFAAEIARHCTSVLQFPAEDRNIVILGKNGFEFDKILCGSAQDEVYEMVRPILRQVWAGYSATVMAYGQTGAGKTYTMGTGRGKFSLESEGVVPRTVRELFELNTDNAAEVSVSFMEVYNEGVYDLLSAFPTRKMQARAFRDLGLQEIPVFSVEDALKRLEEGIEARRVSETLGNEKSSRSHAIFSLHLRRFNREEESETRSLIHLVDLAGSEAVGKAGNQGSLKQEGISINQGLLALSNCIRAVIQKNQHIPVRNTALTNVLQDTLKGQCLLALIACVSPSSKDEQETAQTLRFAQAFHKIKSRPHIQKIVAQHAKNLNRKPSNLVTPSFQRKPFSSIGNSVTFQPNVRVSNYQFVSRRTLGSPTEFSESSFASSKATNISSASIFSHFSEQDFSELVSNALGERMEILKKETEALVNKKIEDALKNIGAQVQPANANPEDNSLVSENEISIADISHSTAISVNKEDFAGCSTPKKTETLQTSPQCDTNKSTVFVNDLIPITPYTTTTTILPLEPCSPAVQPPVKLRRSLRLSCMAVPVFHPEVGEEERLEKRKLRRSIRLSCMDLPEFLRTKDEEPERKRRCSVATIPVSDINSEAHEEPLRKVRRSARLSVLPQKGFCCTEEQQGTCQEAPKPRKQRKSIGPEVLEEILFTESPSAGSAQEKHLRRMLGLLNTENTKVIQQLPTVGPKTGYVIYSYRQIHGNYQTFDDLKKVPGLSANFLKRFFKANNIKV
ncbi:chromosome-associated kinesin KIF4 [Neocloeon triangulifer]|uniref:chromosome-associated kinesin KIF4 n=1 Tax=Neocloeon triangulifer TaxID=2078957 RepID=UPI00286F4E36|nr:chromosome-associated kinesin KIF4 [Neocloeon triangulifer]